MTSMLSKRLLTINRAKHNLSTTRNDIIEAWKNDLYWHIRTLLESSRDSGHFCNDWCQKKLLKCLNRLSRVEAWETQMAKDNTIWKQCKAA